MYGWTRRTSAHCVPVTVPEAVVVVPRLGAVSRRYWVPAVVTQELSCCVVVVGRGGWSELCFQHTQSEGAREKAEEQIESSFSLLSPPEETAPGV